MTVRILGTLYTIHYRTETKDDKLRGCYGYMDWTTKEIVINTASIELGNKKQFMQKVLRHEIVHAFLVESGLHECSGETDAWAINEIMIDWFARQGQKIYKAWKEADAV